MSRDIFDDRNGFTAARRAFVTKQKPEATPARLARHRPLPPPDPTTSPCSPADDAEPRPLVGNAVC